MSNKSKIEWTDATWSPITGCTKVSHGCTNCYAERVWKRLSAINMPYHGRKFTDVKCHPERLEQPRHWRKPRRVFVNSMSDLFHEEVPFSYIRDVFITMQDTRRHVYQILTKRPARMFEFFKWWYSEIDDSLMKDIYPHVWLGVSIEDQPTADERVTQLLQCPAAVRWLSIEPMLGPVDLENIAFEHEFLYRVDVLRGSSRQDGCNEPKSTPKIDWIVVGGESGPKARPMHPGWVGSIRDHCQAAKVPFFFKHWGEYRYKKAGVLPGRKFHPDQGIEDFLPEIVPGRFVRCGKKLAGRMLDGRLWEEYP